MILVYTFGVALVASQVYSMAYRVMAVLGNQTIKRRLLSPPLLIFHMLLTTCIIVGIGYAVHTTTMRDTVSVGMKDYAQGISKDLSKGGGARQRVSPLPIFCRKNALASPLVDFGVPAFDPIRGVKQ